MGISGCILAKNEASNIRNCIDHFASFVDEIIVVDNGSTDETGEIAESMGCIVVREESLRGDLARNRYLEVATEKWILVLDVDEVLDARCVGEIRKLTEDTDNDVMGYTLPRYEYFGEGKWASISILRLFRNNPLIKYNNYPIHNSPGPSIRQIGGKIVGAEFPIHHFDILIKGRTAQKREIYKNSLINEIEQTKGKNDLYLYLLYNFLGTEYTASKMYENAENLYEKTISECRNNPVTSGYYDLALLYLAQNSLLVGNFDKSRDCVSELLEKKSFLVDRAYVVLAELEYQLGFTEVAKFCCMESLKINPFQANQYVNLASLSDSKKEKSIYIEKAIQLNSYLLNPKIHVRGETPNIFAHQTVFLSSVGCINDLIEECSQREKPV